jgi:hypothetical protein
LDTVKDGEKRESKEKRGQVRRNMEGRQGQENKMKIGDTCSRGGNLPTGKNPGVELGRE